MATQEAHADERRADIQRDMAGFEAALAKCDKETQRWAEAYAGEVINLAELKAYRADIDTRRQSLQADHAACQAKLDAIGQTVGRVEALMGYCERVRRRLQTFDAAEKRLAFEALDVRVTWIPGGPLRIEGTIPLEDIAPIAPCWYAIPLRCRCR